MAAPGPVDVVMVYAFDCSSASLEWQRANRVYWTVQKKLVALHKDCTLSYIYAKSADNTYTTEKRSVADINPLVGSAIAQAAPLVGRMFARARLVAKENIQLPADAIAPLFANKNESETRCTKNMASGLMEAHRLISQSERPNGVVLLVSDGLLHGGDFFDRAEEFVSTVPVHTFTLGGDANNQGLRAIAAHSPGGTFHPAPLPEKPNHSEPFSQLLDGILAGAVGGGTNTMDDDEEPPTWNAGSTKGLVTIKEVKYLKDDAALSADTVTAEVEIAATSSTAVREGLDLVAVLDVSARMAEGKQMESMKQAMRFVIMKLTPVDRLSVVVFSDGAVRLSPLRCVTPAAQEYLIAVVDGLAARGGTRIRAGLEAGLAVVAGRVHTKARTANVFLMSDGRQTAGDAGKVDPGQAAVYTFAFGKDADHGLMSDIAARSPGGTFNAVPEGADLTVPFSQLLAGLLTVVAQDVQLTFTPKTADGDVDTVAVAPGTDYTQTTVESVVTIRFGTLFAGEGRRVVITVALKESAADAEYDAPLAEAQHRYSAQGKVQKQRPQDIQILRTRNPSEEPGASTKARQLQAELARRQHAGAISRARALADGGDLDGARYKLADAQNALEDILLDDGQRLVTSLRAELVQLIKLMGTQELYGARGRAFALAAETSHGRQRYAARGDDGDALRLFSTPRMDAYLQQAKDFDKDPTAPLPSADEDVKQEIAANPLAAVSAELASHLRQAIEAMQAIAKVVATST